MNTEISSSYDPNSLKSLSDLELLSGARHASLQETAWGLAHLHYLREIEDRGLHTQKGKSLFAFIREEYACAESTAYEKLQALRLLRAVPEVEERIKEGSITMTVAAQIQSFTDQAARKEIEVPSKLELIEELDGMSKREVKKALAAYAPELPRHDQVRELDGERVEHRFTSSKRLERNLEKLKALRSHVNPSPTMEELLFDVTELLLHFIDPEKKEERARKRKEKREERQKFAQANPEQGGQEDEEEAYLDSLVLLRPAEVKWGKAEVERRVWVRDGGKCTYVDPVSGSRCSSTHQLEYDHIRPKAQGGADTVGNLRLRCRVHNALHAIEIYGWEKMRPYLSGR